MYELILAVLIGIAVGLIAAFFGIGGGVIFVPVLYLLFGLDIHHATATSLLAVFITSMSSATAYARKKKVIYHLGLILVCSAIAGTIVGAYLASIAPEFYLRVAFSVVLIFAAVNLVKKEMRKKSQTVPTSTSLVKYSKKNLPFGVLCEFFAGMASAALGIGGGVINVPIMVLILGVPIHFAVATSCFMIVITSISGVLQRGLIYGHVLPLYGIALGIGAVIGAQIGARIAIRTKPRVLSVLFAMLLVFTAIRMLL